MRNILLLLIFLIFGANIVLAQQDPQITFPIEELGNCNNVQTCKVFCDQKENQEACIAFAKSKDLYKHKISEQKVNALTFAKEELGCDTITSCKSLCEQKENQQKCQDFAVKHRLANSSSQNAEILAKAKQNLNCDSYESCKTLCDEKENYTKCAALLQGQATTDERAMFEKYKPKIKEYLGCDSLVTCMAYCMNPLNSAKCTQLADKITEQEGGAAYSESPEVWCPKVSSECAWDGTNCVCHGPQTCAQSNDIPGCTWDGKQCNCPGIAEDPPEVWCPKAGPGCAWDGTYCICPGSFETPIQSGTQEPGEIWCPKIGQYCIWDGSSCTCWDECVKAGGIWNGSSCTPKQESPEVWCSKIGSYCVWDGSSCTCWDDCVKSGGNWTGQKCEYGGSTNQSTLEPNTEPPEVSCLKNPDCKWTSETCLCTAFQEPQTEVQPPSTPQVQGITTNHGFLQQIIDFLLGR